MVDSIGHVSYNVVNVNAEPISDKGAHQIYIVRRISQLQLNFNRPGVVITISQYCLFKMKFNIE